MKLRDIRGRFTAGLFPLSFRRKVYLASMFFLLILTLLGRVGENWVTKELEYIAAKPVEAAEIVTPDTIEEMKNDVLDRLAKCESSNNPNVAVVFDTNAKASLGLYQWQIASFQFYWEKMTGEKLTARQAAVKALTDDEARKLAAYVLFETDNGSSKDWVRCTAAHDLDTLISFIKNHS